MEMQVKCYYCEDTFTADFDAGDLTCPNCQHVNKRTAQRFSEIRNQLVQRLDRYEKEGCTHVRWLSANDEHVCVACQERNKQTFSIEQAREILETHFCLSDGYEQSCRCILAYVRNPVHPKTKPGKYKVVSHNTFNENKLTVTFDIKKRSLIKRMCLKIKALFK